MHDDNYAMRQLWVCKGVDAGHGCTMDMRIYVMLLKLVTGKSHALSTYVVVIAGEPDTQDKETLVGMRCYKGIFFFFF